MSDFEDFSGGGGGQQQGGRPAFDTSKLGPIDDLKLRMYADPVNGGKRKPSLSVSMYENNPRLVVKTNMDNDKDYGKITAAMDMPIFFSFLDVLESVINGPNDSQQRIVNKKRKFINGESKILDDTYTIVGKDKDGVVWISVLAYDKERPRIKFEFGSNEYHGILNRDGSPYDKGKWTQHAARGWMEIMRRVLSQVFVKNYEYVDYYAKKSDRKQASGGNNGGNRGGGYQQRPGGYQGNQQNARQAPQGGTPSGIQDDWQDDMPM